MQQNTGIFSIQFGRRLGNEKLGVALEMHLFDLLATDPGIPSSLLQGRTKLMGLKDSVVFCPDLAHKVYSIQ